MAYIIQIDDEVREATADEIAVINARQASIQISNEAILAKEATRASALAKLGLTADEVAALFG